MKYVLYDTYNECYMEVNPEAPGCEDCFWESADSSNEGKVMVDFNHVINEDGCIVEY